MQIRGLTLAQATEVVARVSADGYYGNIVIRDGGDVGRTSCHFRLWAVNAHAWGARTSSSGRYAHAASWEAYRDVIRACLEAGARSVHTGMTDNNYYSVRASTHGMTYRSVADFDARYMQSASYNIGSQLYPVTMPDLTV